MSVTRLAYKYWLFLILPCLVGATAVILNQTRERQAMVSSTHNTRSSPALETNLTAVETRSGILTDRSSQNVNPTVNAHALVHHTLGRKGWVTRGFSRIARRLNYHPGPTFDGSISTAPMDTKLSGSTILVSIGRGNISAFSQKPTDNIGNSPFTQLGPPHNYQPQYPASGTALYAVASAKGGIGHIVTAKTPATDEITVAAVEIQHGGIIRDYKWNEVLKGHPLTSLSVTTTGPATLVAFWWGDGDEHIEHHVATPNNGFKVIDSLLSRGLLVQAAIATKDVSEAGSYDVTWDSDGQEGAQLYLVAVQSATKPSLHTPSPAGDGISLRQKSVR